MFVAFDDPVPIDKEHRLKEKEVHLKYAYSTINMERLIDNKEGVKWGDAPIINTNLAPLGSRPPGNGGRVDEQALRVGIDKFSKDLAGIVINRIRGGQ